LTMPLCPTVPYRWTNHRQRTIPPARLLLPSPPHRPRLRISSDCPARQHPTRQRQPAVAHPQKRSPVMPGPPPCQTRPLISPAFKVMHKCKSADPVHWGSCPRPTRLRLPSQRPSAAVLTWTTAAVAPTCPPEALTTIGWHVGATAAVVHVSTA